MNKYQEAFENIIWNFKCVRTDAYKDLDDLKVSIDLLQELVDKNERLVAHVKLAIKMLEENSPYAIETLKEVIEQDWSEDENNQSN